MLLTTKQVFEQVFEQHAPREVRKVQHCAEWLDGMPRLLRGGGEYYTNAGKTFVKRGNLLELQAKTATPCQRHYGVQHV